MNMTPDMKTAPNKTTTPKWNMAQENRMAPENEENFKNKNSCSYSYHWLNDKLWRKKTFNWGRPLLMEEYLWWKTTFAVRYTLIEYNHWGRQPMEDVPRWMTSLEGRWPWPLRGDDFWRKTSFEGNILWGNMKFEGKQTLRESFPWGKISFEGRWALKEDEIWGNKTFA